MFRNRFGQKVCTHGNMEMCRRPHRSETGKMRVVFRKRIMTSRKG